MQTISVTINYGRKEHEAIPLDPSYYRELTSEPVMESIIRLWDEYYTTGGWNPEQKLNEALNAHFAQTETVHEPAYVAGFTSALNAIWTELFRCYDGVTVGIVTHYDQHPLWNKKETLLRALTLEHQDQTLLEHPLFLQGAGDAAAFYYIWKDDSIEKISTWCWTPGTLANKIYPMVQEMKQKASSECGPVG
jgi:hypothetical protein